MDKQLAKQIHTELQAAIKAVTDRYNLKPAKSQLNYSDDRIGLKVEWIMPGGRTKTELNYCRYQHALRLPELGTRFQLKPNKWAVTAGLLVGGPYRTLVYKELDSGKLFKLDVVKMQKHCPDLTVTGVKS